MQSTFAVFFSNRIYFDCIILYINFFSSMSSSTYRIGLVMIIIVHSAFISSVNRKFHTEEKLSRLKWSVIISHSFML